MKKINPMKSKSNKNVCVKLTVSLLTVFALVAGVPQVTMAKKKTKAETAEKSSSAKSKKKEESKISKAEAEAKEMVSDLTTTQKKKLLGLLNDGDVDGLTAITGVGEVRAKAIIKARPYKSVEDLYTVEGVGNKVFGDVIAYGKAPAASGKSAKSKTASKKTSKARKKKTT